MKLTFNKKRLDAFLPLFAILAYGLVILLVRLYWRGEQLQLDEAEQIIKAQTFQLGYSAQPPLYTYLQYVFFSIFGHSLFTVTLLRCVLISLFLLSFYYFNYYFFNKTHSLATLTTLSLALLPTYSKKLPWIFTDSLMVLFIASVTLQWLFKGLKSQNYRWYLVFGLLLGLGILTKYNYLLFIIAISFAFILKNQTRKLLLDKRLFISLSVMLVVASPYFYWINQNLDVAFSSIHKLENHRYQNNIFEFISFLGTELYFLAPFLVVFTLVFFKEYSFRLQTKTKAFVYYLIFLNSIVFLIYMLGFISSFKKDWFIPLLFFIPTYFFGSLTKQPASQKQTIYSSICVFALFLGFGYGIISKNKILGFKHYQDFDIAPLSKALDAKKASGTLISNDRYLLANLLIELKNVSAVQMVNSKYYEGKFNHREQNILVWQCLSVQCPIPGVLKHFIQKKNQQNLNIRYVYNNDKKAWAYSLIN